MQSTANKGFTILEMAVVVVIIAVLIGSVLLTKELIYSAQLRGVVKQIEMFDQAANTFRLKYACIPGDCLNASMFGFDANVLVSLAELQKDQNNFLAYMNPVSSAFAVGSMAVTGGGTTGVVPVMGAGTGFPSSSFGNSIAGGVLSPTGGGGGGGGSTPPSDMVTLTSVNGNGDGDVNNVTNLESVLFFALLHQAGMINQYDTATGRVAFDLPAHVSLPPSYDFQAFWFANDLVADTGSLIKESGTYYWPIASFSASIPAAAPLTPVQAHALDTKRDDGFPLSGRILSSSDAYLNTISGPYFDEYSDKGPAGADSNFCITMNNEYNTQNSRPLCATVFRAAAL